MRRLGLFLCVAAIFFAAPVTAREKSDGLLGGFYIGLGVNYVTFVGNDMESYDDAFGFLNLTILGREFESIAVEFNLRHDSGHSSDISSDAHFNGIGFDVKWFPSPANDEQRMYLLAGVSRFWLAFDNSADEISGLGFNLGGGIEHFLDSQLSITADLVYTILTYDRKKINDVESDLDPSLSGDAITAKVAANLYF